MATRPKESAGEIGVLELAQTAADALQHVSSTVLNLGCEQHGAEASEAQSILALLARALSQHQHHRAFAAFDAARHAAELGDPEAAAAAALQAQEDAALAMWVACVGGLQVAHELSSRQEAAVRAAAEAMRLAEAAVDVDGSSQWTVAPPPGARDVAADTLGAWSAIASHRSRHSSGQPSCPPAGLEAANSAGPYATAAGFPSTAGTVAVTVTGTGGAAATAEAVSAPAAAAATLAGAEAPPLNPTTSAAGLSADVASTGLHDNAPGPDGDRAVPAAPGTAPCEQAQPRAGAEAGAFPAPPAAAATAACPDRAAAQQPATSSDVAAADSGAAGLLSAHQQAAERSSRQPQPQSKTHQHQRPGAGQPSRSGPVRPSAAASELMFPLPAGAAGLPVYPPDWRDWSVPLTQLFSFAQALAATGRMTEHMLYICGLVASRLASFGSEVESVVLQMWLLPPPRCSLTILLSYSVRQILELPAGAAAGACLAASLRLMELLTVYLTSVSLTLTADGLVAAEVLRLLLRTDLLPVLARVFHMMHVAAQGAIERLDAEEGEAAAPQPPPAVEVAAEADVDATADAGAAAQEARAAADQDAASSSSAAAVMAGLMLEHLGCRDVGTRDMWLGLYSGPFRLLHALLFLDQQAEGSPQVGEAIREAVASLRGAVLRSRVLDHAARAAALMARAAELAGGRVGVGPARDAFFALPLCGSLSCAAVASVSPVRAVAVWADAVLSGPCVQQFLLLHTVSQVSAADGGAGYGLPRAARLPAWIDRDAEPLPSLTSSASGAGPRRGGSDQRGSSAGSGSGSGGRGKRGGKGSRGGGSGGGASGASPASGPLLLSTNLVIGAFHWWPRHRARPCSDRALRFVCERAAAAASASWGEGAGAAEERASGGGGSGGGAVLCCRFEPRSAMELALAALQCAAVLTAGGAAGSFRGLWAPAMRAVEAAVRMHGASGGAPLVHSPLRLLALMQVPRLQQLSTGGGAGSLPADPDPDLAAVLAAGYVPCLERTIRAEMRGPCSPAEKLRRVLETLSSLTDNPLGAAGVLAYGDPIAVAPLLATCSKVITRTIATVPDLPADEAKVVINGLSRLLRGIAASMAGLWGWEGCMPRPENEHWWRRPRAAGTAGAGDGRVELDAGTVAAATAAAATAAAATAADACERSGPGPSRVTAANHDEGDDEQELRQQQQSSCGGGRLAPLHQLSLLGAFAGARWLEALHPLCVESACWGLRLPAIAPELPRLLAASCVATVGAVRLLLLAYLDCREMAAAAGSTAAAAGPAASDTAAASSAAASAAAAAADAASWEALLLGPLDVADLMERTAWSAWANWMSSTGQLGPLAALIDTLLLLLVAFPRQGRALLQSRRPQTTTLLAWLRDAIPADSQTDGTRHFLELAPAVAEGREPSAADVARAREGEDDSTEDSASLAVLLPPPRVVAAALGQMAAGCANPTCANFEGDSEAGLRLGEPCVGCRAVRYCSQGCRVAHWGAGHRAVCAGGGGGGGGGGARPRRRGARVVQG